MPYYCSCRDLSGNTVTSTVISNPHKGRRDCIEIQQVQFRLYNPSGGASSVINWDQTFTLTPEKALVICKGGNDVKAPWTSITETLMKVTQVKDYGEVVTSIDSDGNISFDKFDVVGRCQGQCPLNFSSVSNANAVIHPFTSTT
jgi:hypothetical protein